MRSTVCTAAVVAASCSLGHAFSVPRFVYDAPAKRGMFSKSLTNRSNLDLGTNELGLPAGGRTTNCVSIGFLPSEGDSASPRYTMAQINSRLGAKASTYGWYAQISSSSFDGAQLLAVKDDVVASGAVFVASVMPSINLNQVTADVASQVAAVMKKFTDDGVTVWLRFAHEVNWYLTDGTYHGTAEDFITAWKNIYNANCKGNEKVKCFWSPNQAGSMSDLQPFWPGQEFVDIVGIDCYPKSSDDTSGSGLFDQLYGDFYNTFSKPYGLPFAIGETAAGTGQKEGWLKQLVNQDKTKYPNYVSMSWFEFDKEADFRIVMTDDSALQQAKDILLSHDGDSCGGESNARTRPTTAQPTGTAAPTSKATTTSKPQSTGTIQCDWG